MSYFSSSCLLALGGLFLTSVWYLPPEFSVLSGFWFCIIMGLGTELGARTDRPLEALVDQELGDHLVRFCSSATLVLQAWLFRDIKSCYWTLFALASEACSALTMTDRLFCKDRTHPGQNGLLDRALFDLALSMVFGGMLLGHLADPEEVPVRDIRDLVFLNALLGLGDFAGDLTGLGSLFLVPQALFLTWTWLDLSSLGSLTFQVSAQIWFLGRLANLFGF